MRLARRRLTWFRVAALAALAITLAGALAPLVAGVGSRRYQVWRAFPVTPDASALDRGFRAPIGPGHERYEVGGRDPWGHPWRRREAYEGWSVESIGPDGEDDGGGDDDVAVDARWAAVDLAPSWSVAGALSLLWLAAALRALTRPRGPELWAEVGRALFAASAPTLALGLLVHARGLPDALEDGPPLLVPRPVAAVGAAWLGLSLAALGWRCRASARRGRAAVRWAPLVAVPLLTALALTAAWRGDQALRERQAREGRLALACAGDAPSFGEVCRRGEPGELETLIATAPPYRRPVRLDADSVRALRRFGPAANRYVVSTLVDEHADWDARTRDVPREGLAHLLRHDPQLQELVAQWRGSPWVPLSAKEPLLRLALLGPDPETNRVLAACGFAANLAYQELIDSALHALLVVSGHPAAPRTREEVARLDVTSRRALHDQLDGWLLLHGARDPRDEAEERLVAGREAPELTIDRWLILRLARPSSPAAPGLLLDGARLHANRVDVADETMSLWVVGPLQAPVRKGTLLTVVDGGEDRRLTVSLPGMKSGAFWIDADPRTGQSSVRFID